MAPGPVSALTAGDTLLAHFWDLASLEEETRQKAASALVDALVKDQKEYEAETSAEQSDEDDETDAAAGASGNAVDRALRRCSPLMVYAFKRLCRGLGSSRQGARQGFSLAVTSLLASTACMGPSEAVAAIEGVLEPVGKGSELRDALLGRIFGYAAVTKSRRPLPAELAASMAAALVSAAHKKSFLQEVAGTVLLELCQAVDDATLAKLVQDSESPLAPWLTARPDDSSPEALLLALRLWPRLPAAAAQASPLLPPGFRPSKPLPAALFTDPSTAAGSKAVVAAAAAFFSREHLTALLPVLRATSASHPRLHSVWTTLLALLMPGFTADKDQRSSATSAAAKGSASGAPVRPLTDPLEAFWGCVVEGDLVQSSHERKYLAFTLFLLLLPHLGPEHVPLVFTPSFLRCLALNLKKVDSHLHTAAKKCMERIAAHCAKAAVPEVRIAVSLALQRHGGADLERYARTGGDNKAVQAKTDGSKAAADAKGGDPSKAVSGKAGVVGNDGTAKAQELSQYVQQLQGTFLGAGSSSGVAETVAEEGEESMNDASGAQQQRQWAVEQLCGVLKQSAAPAAVKHSVLQFLAVNALFSVDKAAAKKTKDAEVKEAAAQSTDIPLGQRQLCAARLITLADILDKQQQQHSKGGKGQQQQQQQEYLGAVVAFVSKLRKSGVGTLAMAAEGQEAAAETAEEAADMLQQTLDRLQARLAAGTSSDAAAASAEQQKLRALAHLLRLLLLHTLADPSTADTALAADLNAVFDVAIEGQAAPQPVEQLPQQEAMGKQNGSSRKSKASSSGSKGDDEGSAEGSEEQQGSAAGEGEEEEQQQPHWHDTLMDVLLSLLARNAAPLPSAPLRDAVEHAFRAFAEDLTATGMADMLRVLSKPLDSGSGTGEDVYASSEEEEEEEGAMEVDGEEQGEEDSSDEDVHLEEAREAESDSEEEEGGKQAGGATAEAEIEGSDDEEMSDEAMFRLDAKLASYFATLKEGKGGNAARAARQELVNFKMRVAALVEAYCKRVPASQLLPTAVAPLLSGLAAASRPGGHQPLAERLSGLIMHKLCSSKAEAAGTGMSAEDLEQQLRRTLYLASRATEKRVAAAAAAAYVFLQRAAAGSPSEDCRAKGIDSARAALSDFFTKKKTRLQRPLLETLLHRVPALVPALLPDVLKHAATARNDYLRLEAFLLLSTALKAGGSNAAAALTSCSTAVAAAVMAAVASNFSKQQRQVEALKIAGQLLESGRAAKVAVGGKEWDKARQAASKALDGAAGNAKLASALQRLEGLLAGPKAGSQQQGGKRAKPSSKPGLAAKKQKV